MTIALPRPIVHRKIVEGRIIRNQIMNWPATILRAFAAYFQLGFFIVVTPKLAG